MMSLNSLFDSVLLNQVWHLEGWTLTLLAWVLPTITLIGAFVLLGHAFGYLSHCLQVCNGGHRLTVELFQTLWQSETSTLIHTEGAVSNYQQLKEAISLSFQTDELSEVETICLLMVALTREIIEGKLHWNHELTQHLCQRLQQEELFNNRESQATALVLADVLSQARISAKQDCLAA